MGFDYDTASKQINALVDLATNLKQLSFLIAFIAHFQEQKISRGQHI